jgi:RNA polymerase sigma-70 factor (ECF subfamily)
MKKQKKGRLSAEALQRLVSQRERFVGFVERRVGSRALAEDIVQAAFVRSLERGENLKDEESVVAWFYRMLRNAVIDHYRSSASRGTALEAFAAEVKRNGQPSQTVKREICSCIGGLLQELRPEYKMALQLAEIDERPLMELASQTGISASNAAVRVHRARQALLKQVQRTCGSCVEHQCMDCDCKR